MEGVSEVLGLETIEWRDKKLTLPRPNFLTEAAFRKHLEAEDFRRVLLHQELLGPLGYQQALTSWRRDCAAGVWSFGAAEAQRALASPEHFLELVWLCLTQVKEQENLTRKDVEKLLEEKGGDVVTKVQRLLAPNPTTPPAAGGEATR